MSEVLERDDAAYEAEFNAVVAAREAGQPVDAVVVEPVEPVAEPKDEPAPAPAAAVPAPEPSRLSKDDEALVASVPEDQRTVLRDRLSKAARLEQDNRSMAGRVSAYQRRYEEATGKRTPAPTPQVTAEHKVEWDSFVAEYPEIGKAIEARFAAANPAADTTELVEYVQDQKRQKFLEDAWAAVDAVHPGWRTTGATTEFKTWKASSPAYEKLASSDDIADAVALFDLYDAHRTRHPAPATNTTAADQVAARRELQAAGAAAPSGRAATPNQNLDLNDEDQLFAFYAAKSNARLKGRFN